MIRYNERVLAYIDILGFKDAVDNTVRCSDCKNKEKCTDCKKIGKHTTRKDIDISAQITEIDNLFDEIHHQVKIRKLINKLEIKDRVVSQISDSVVISYSIDSYFHHILLDVYFLCVKALEKGFLFRGVIVCGKIIHTENKLFGPAFLKAYDMEKKQAIFPRIIIDDKFLDIAKNNYSQCSDPDTEYNNLLELIPCDFDGKRYINYIDKLYTGVGVGDKEEKEHRIWVKEYINKLEEKMKIDGGVKCKYLWLKEKFEKSRGHTTVSDNVFLSK